MTLSNTEVGDLLERLVKNKEKTIALLREGEAAMRQKRIEALKDIRITKKMIAAFRKGNLK